MRLRSCSAAGSTRRVRGALVHTSCNRDKQLRQGSSRWRVRPGEYRNHHLLMSVLQTSVHA